MNSLEDAFGCSNEIIYFLNETVYVDIIIEDDILKDYENLQIRCVVCEDIGKIVLTL